MRKFGIRALACSLAVMLVAGLSAPAVASAEDILLISPAPSKAEKVLHITADMVDEDGEIVISGGTYDRVFVSKEAAAKDIYFDQVTVGELVVEGGNKAKIQLWEVDAEKVTVQEPELEKLSLFDLIPLLKDEETRDAAIEMYQKSLERDNYALSVAPTIVTMDDAKIDELVTRTNVKLDLGAGEVGEVALEASATQNRVNVTLSNYEGDVSYKGGEGFSSVTLKSVDSRIKNLKVEESNANNYFTLTAKESVVLRTEVAGNANVALNAPMGAIEVTEAATAANVSILNVAEELNVAAKGANIQLTGNANVTFATVTSDDVKITGIGSLGEADLQGKGAYVSTFGTKVEGENTYVRPVYVQPKVVVTDINLTGGVGAVVTKNSDGSSTVVYTPNHKTASFVVPEEVDKDRISSVKIELTYNGQFCVKFGGTSKADEYPGWGASGETDGEFTYSINCAKDKLSRLDFMCLEAPLELTIKKITFNLLDEAPEPEPEAPAPEQNAPRELPENYVVYGIDDLTKGGYGYEATEASHGGEHVALGENYQEVRYMFAEDIDLSQYSKMILTFATKSAETSDCVVIKLVDKDAPKDEYKNPNPMDTLWDKTTSNTADFEVDLSKYASEKLSWVAFSAKEKATELYFYRIAFVPKEAQGDGDDDQGFAETKSYVAADLSCAAPSWNPGTTATDNGDGSVTVAYAGDYHEVRFQIPDDVTAGDYEKIVVTASGSTINSGVELLDSEGNVIAFWWSKSATNKQDLELTYSTLGYSADGVMTEEQLAKKIAYVSFKNAVEGQTGEITVHNIKFVGTEPEGMMKEFFIVPNGTFTDVDVKNDGQGNINANAVEVYLDGNNFKNLLPDELKADETVANKFTTLEGIIEMVNYFEVEITLTEATAVSEDKASYAPQAQVYMQSSDWSAGTWGAVQGNIGQPSAGNPKTGTFQHSTTHIESWTSPTIGKLGIQIFNALEGSKVSGTYTIKVVLK